MNEVVDNFVFTIIRLSWLIKKLKTLLVVMSPPVLEAHSPTISKLYFLYISAEEIFTIWIHDPSVANEVYKTTTLSMIAVVKINSVNFETRIFT